jgi:hypothetical protein
MEQVATRWWHQVASRVAGHAALGGAFCIAPADHHGHQNGQQQRILSEGVALRDWVCPYTRR